MTTDYTSQQQKAYEAIERKGGAISFLLPPLDTVPADPDAEWEGNSAQQQPYPHVAVLFPIKVAERANPESNHRVLVPALNLPFEIKVNQEFTDAAGRKYAITAVQILAPDPSQVILFDCECALWPSASD